MSDIDQATSADRAHALAGFSNLRDLGGLATPGGRIIRRGRVFRADCPLFVGDELLTAAATLGLHTVVDLRRGSEVAHVTVPWGDCGVSHRRHPLSAGALSSWHASYPSYLLHRPESVVDAVREVMAAPGPVLFHCAAGKDRTGVVAALLLDALGVQPALIVDDYLQTVPNFPAVWNRMIETPVYRTVLRGQVIEDQLPREETIMGLLDWLDAEGGAAGWLTAQGLEDALVESFRGRLLDG